MTRIKHNRKKYNNINKIYKRLLLSLKHNLFINIVFKYSTIFPPFQDVCQGKLECLKNYSPYPWSSEPVSIDVKVQFSFAVFTNCKSQEAVSR